MSDDDANAKSKQFDDLIASVSSAVDEAKSSIAAAKDTALSEIGQIKLSIAAAQETANLAIADLNKSKAGVESASAAAITEIERSQGKAQSSKIVIEAAANEIDRIKNAVATARGAIQESQKASSNDAATVHQSMVTIDELRAKAVREADDLAAKNLSVSDKVKELQEVAKSLEDILRTITDARNETETKRVSIESDVTKIGEVRANFETLNTQTQQQFDALVPRRAALDAQISEIDAIHTRTEEIRKALFDETDGKKSFNSEIEELRARVASSVSDVAAQREEAQAFFTKFKTDTDAEKAALLGKLTDSFSDLHVALEGEIRALLPSAGAAGLASTYYDAKSRYAPTSFAGKYGAGATSNGSIWSWWRRKFGYNPASVVATIVFYALFITPILAIVFIFYDLIRHLPDQKIAELDIRIITLRVLIAVPLATISAFGFASLRSYRRLYEEYNHKQRVMELYASFRKEIAENGTDDQKKQLLTIMLDAVADKSYLAADSKGDKGQGELLTGITSLTNLLNNLTKH